MNTQDRIKLTLESGEVIYFERTSSEESEILGLVGEAKEDVIKDQMEAIQSNQLFQNIKMFSEELMAALKLVSPDKLSVEFGVEVGVETGKLITIIAKGSLKGHIKVTLDWSK